MLKVVFEDQDILVLDKPPGLVVTSSETYHEPTLEDILRRDGLKIERAGIVHRLDKDTSGLLVVAKTAEVLKNLQYQFKARTVNKEYLALVHGSIKEGGKVEAAIERNPVNREKFMVISSKLEEKEDEMMKLHGLTPVVSSPFSAESAEATIRIHPRQKRGFLRRRIKGREAVTEYKPLKLLIMSSEFMEKIFAGFNKIQFRKLRTMNYQQFTLLSCHPLTGRTHQIRVHLKYLGFPIVGDEKYGGRKVVRLDHRFCPRQFLHAAKLRFNHPATGKRVEFESPLPKDLEEALGVLSE